MEILSFHQKIVLMMIMTMMFGNMVKSDQLHLVGGDKFSWRPNVNFTEWASHEHFHLDDWLYFGYDRHMFNVLEVNKSSYENCIDKGFIRNISRGAGRDVFELEELKTYYFLTGGGYCWKGMKLAIQVNEGPVAPTPAPSPKSASTSNICAIQSNQILLVFIFLFIWGISSNNISY